MKFPKNRANCYVVVREIDSYMEMHSILGVFKDAVEADDYKDVCAAEWFEKTKGQPANFDVRISTFYG
jgi:general stress protein 26